MQVSGQRGRGELVQVPCCSFPSGGKKHGHQLRVK